MTKVNIFAVTSQQRQANRFNSMFLHFVEVAGKPYRDWTRFMACLHGGMTSAWHLHVQRNN